MVYQPANDPESRWSGVRKKNDKFATMFSVNTNVLVGVQILTWFRVWLLHRRIVEAYVLPG
jgi:hypothetical protein